MPRLDIFGDTAKENFTLSTTDYSYYNILGFLIKLGNINHQCCLLLYYYTADSDTYSKGDIALCFYGKIITNTLILSYSKAVHDFIFKDSVFINGKISRTFCFTKTDISETDFAMNNITGFIKSHSQSAYISSYIKEADRISSSIKFHPSYQRPEYLDEFIGFCNNYLTKN